MTTTLLCGHPNESTDDYDVRLPPICGGEDPRIDWCWFGHGWVSKNKPFGLSGEQTPDQTMADYASLPPDPLPLPPAQPVEVGTRVRWIDPGRSAADAWGGVVRSIRRHPQLDEDWLVVDFDNGNERNVRKFTVAHSQGGWSVELADDVLRDRVAKMIAHHVSGLDSAVPLSDDFKFADQLMELVRSADA